MPYAKIWTDIKNDEWFVSLPCVARGLFIQLIIHARSWENSTIFLRNFPHASTEFGLDRSTCAKYLRKFHEDGKIILSENDGILRITVVNYDRWQGLTQREKSGKNHVFREKSEKNSPYIREEKRREKNKRNKFADLPKQVLDDLNSRLKKLNPDKRGFKLIDSTRKSINGRLEEGYDIQDFQKVHQVKITEWWNTEMEKHLNPTTLYRPANFEKYLNQDEVRDEEKPKTIEVKL